VGNPDHTPAILLLRVVPIKTLKNTDEMKQFSHRKKNAEDQEVICWNEDSRNMS